MAQIASRAEQTRDRSLVDPDLGRLKQLLLVDEHRELSTLRADLARIERSVGSEDYRQLSAIRADLVRIEHWLGSEERFARAVADSLVAALKVVEVESHRDLVAVMAPLVVSGIRREIEQSRDTMVETLYPITGRMVTAAVAAMFRQLSDDINRKIEEGLSPRLFRLRLKAMITRRPLSALILAEAGRGHLQRLLFIERATGAVMASTRPDGLADPEPTDVLNLLGGLVSAVVEFAGHALSDVQGELRQLDFGGQIVFLRASPLCIVVAVTGQGAVAPRLPTFIDESFLTFLDQLHASEAVDHPVALAGLHEAIVQKMVPAARKTSKVSPLAAIAVVLGLGLGAAALQSWLTAREHSRQDAILADIGQAGILQSYPVDLAFDRAARVIRVKGVVSTRSASDALDRALARAFPEWPVESRLAVLAETFEPGAVVRADVSRIEDDERRRTATTAAQIGAVQSQIPVLQDGLTRLAGDEVPRLRQEMATLDTPMRRLDDIVRGTAIFFEVNADAYRDLEAAKQALQALADALKPTTARLRIIGFADGSGTPQANLNAARIRAERVSSDLRALGIEPARLTTVSTRAVPPINDEPRSGANRRVVFELVYPAE